MNREPVLPPPNELQFLLSLLRISNPGQTVPRASNELEQLLTNKSTN